MKLFVLAVACAVSTLYATDPEWPQFRGPHGAGLAEGQKPVVEFGPGKNELWSLTVPSGASSPVIAGDRLFLTGFDGGKLFTICISRAEGKERWRKEAPAATIEAYHPVEGSPAASSVATDGEHVVVYFGSCGLLCYDLDGKELWKVKMPVAETDNHFGTGTSPIIDHGRVFLARDLAKGSALFCFDVQDGKQIWKTEREGFNTTYGTPVIWRQDGREDLVVGGALRLKAYDPATGAERWLLRDMPSVSVESPVVGEGMLFCGGWAPGGVDAPMPDFDALLKADADGDGKLSKAEAAKTPFKDFFDALDPNHDGFITNAEWERFIGFLKAGKNGIACIKPGATGDITESGVAWKATKGLPYVPSPVIYRGRMYLVKDGGLATCIDVKTGEKVYEQTRLGIDGAVYASPVAVDGRLYCISLRGVAFVYSAGDQPELLAKADLGERACATPAVVDNVLYYRTATKLWAFGEKK